MVPTTRQSGVHRKIRLSLTIQISRNIFIHYLTIYKHGHTDTWRNLFLLKMENKLIGIIFVKRKIITADVRVFEQCQYKGATLSK